MGTRTGYVLVHLNVGHLDRRFEKNGNQGPWSILLLMKMERKRYIELEVSLWPSCSLSLKLSFAVACTQS